MFGFKNFLMSSSFHRAKLAPGDQGINPGRQKMRR
jgi:hypothetical protein